MSSVHASHLCNGRPAPALPYLTDLKPRAGSEGTELFDGTLGTVEHRVHVQVSVIGLRVRFAIVGWKGGAAFSKAEPVVDCMTMSMFSKIDLRRIAEVSEDFGTFLVGPIVADLFPSVFHAA